MEKNNFQFSKPSFSFNNLKDGESQLLSDLLDSSKRGFSDKKQFKAFLKNLFFKDGCKCE